MKRFRNHILAVFLIAAALWIGWLALNDKTKEESPLSKVDDEVHHFYPARIPREAVLAAGKPKDKAEAPIAIAKGEEKVPSQKIGEEVVAPVVEEVAPAVAVEEVVAPVVEEAAPAVAVEEVVVYSDQESEEERSAVIEEAVVTGIEEEAAVAVEEELAVAEEADQEEVIVYSDQESEEEVIAVAVESGSDQEVAEEVNPVVEEDEVFVYSDQGNDEVELAVAEEAPPAVVVEEVVAVVKESVREEVLIEVAKGIMEEETAYTDQESWEEEAIGVVSPVLEEVIIGEEEAVAVVEELEEALAAVEEEEPIVLGEEGLGDEPPIVVLRGLVLLGQNEPVLGRKQLKGIEGLYVKGPKIPTSDIKLQTLLAPVYLGQELNSERIAEIKNAIYAYYEDHNDPFVCIEVPAQNVSEGVLQLTLVQGRVGEIGVKGNKWFSTSQIERYFKTQEGDEINLFKIERDLDLLNKNPFRRVNLIYTKGKEIGTTDLILAVEDRRPIRVYAGADNTGIETINRQRLFAGITFGNFWWLDHLLTYQYTTSYDLKRFQGHTVQYMAPMGWSNMLNIYGGYSTVDPKMPFPSVKHHGENTQASVRYVIPMISQPRSTQDFAIGFDYKMTNNTIAYSELIQNFGQNVNLTQLVVEYKRHEEWKSARFDIDLQLFGSPGEIFPHQTNGDFESLRKGAKNVWVYGRGSVRYLQALPKEFQMSLWLQGQGASACLLPSEQFGLGGYASVRGYDERQLSMDNAFLASWELRSPLIPVVTMLRKKQARDALQFLAFADYGWGLNNDTMPTEPIATYLLGVGPGIRYTLDPYVSVRLDWGIKLHKREIFTGGASQVHFNATLSY